MILVIRLISKYKQSKIKEIKIRILDNNINNHKDHMNKRVIK